jgi:hypothetical protein
VSVPDSLPFFSDLPIRDDAPPGSSWGVFGAAHPLGTLNFIGPEEVAAAARLVTDGRVFPLNVDVWSPSPTLFHRSPPRLNPIILNQGESLDDYMDNFYPHGSSHWDALRHYADVDYGFYNGATLETLTTQGNLDLGVHHWARRGIAGRGVLLDVPRALTGTSTSIDPLDYYPITASIIERVADEQGVELRRGDILLVRTGWLGAFTALPEPERAVLVRDGNPAAPGPAGETVPPLYWDRRIAASATDTPVFEAQPGRGGFDLTLHKALIARLGLPIGENWQLDDLADDCARDGRYEFLLTSAPLNVPGGAGTPSNALALK